jgi:hypothetical protein
VFNRPNGVTHHELTLARIVRVLIAPTLARATNKSPPLQEGLMRYWVAAAVCAATIACDLTSALAADAFIVQLNERDRGYRNTGTITLRDPVSDTVLGSYDFATGGFGRGSAPFGVYEVGMFRDTNDDPHRIGPRWMIRQQGQTDDGQAYDPRVNDVRTSLELHAAKRHPGTKGCIGVLGGERVWEEFVRNLAHIIDRVGQVVFTLAGNPAGLPAAAEPTSSAPRLQRVSLRRKTRPVEPNVRAGKVRTPLASDKAPAPRTSAAHKSSKGRHLSTMQGRRAQAS